MHNIFGLTIEDVAMKIALECVSRLEEEIGVSEDTYCYELVIKRLDGSVSEKEVLAELPSEYRDVILWNAGTITIPKSLGVYYNQSEGKVVIE